MIGAGAAPAAPRLETAPLVQHDDASAALLDRKYIHVEAEGGVEIVFADAMLAFMRENLLDDVQQAYAELLPEGEEPEFEIQQASAGRYFYENRKGEKSFITEVCRRVEPSGEMTLVFHVRGKRFFGTFESLVHIEVRAAAETPTAYRVAVYAYPHNGLSRFLARHLNLVERYFHSKTDAMVKLVTRIGHRLCAGGEAPAADETLTDCRPGSTDAASAGPGSLL